MLFNSYEFIFAFLPVTLLGFYLLGARQRDWALLWLTLASLFFYAWWRPFNVLLIAPSIAINYALSLGLQKYNETRPGLARALLLGGIAFNVCFLGYFKYTMFLAGAWNDVFGTNLEVPRILLPLGISFITFQKIAFLVDVHAGRVTSFTFKDYALFVLFFPQLIAGPIVHYREMMPQFQATSARFNAENMAVGVSLFSMGLVKKLLLADPLSRLIAPLYTPPGLAEAWMAALGFTLQIYFDFSGYSDMALGLARFVGIKLPVNFNSPLKATSIIDFWLRWHVSLTRFLTAYLYNPMTLHLTRARMAAGKPLFGGKKTTFSAFLMMLVMPTLVTMTVSGVWHGAGYTYILWGLLHGVLISVNHGWRVIRPRIWADTKRYNRAMKPVGFVLTFLSVVFAMAMFRAPTVTGALSIWSGMLGAHGIPLPEGLLARLGPLAAHLSVIGVHPAFTSGSVFLETSVRIIVLLAIALGLPNSLELLARYEPALGVKPAKDPARLVRWFEWRPSPAWGIGIAAMTLCGILSLGELSEFLYWQF